MLAIACSLRAWPSPLLHDLKTEHDDQMEQFSTCWHVLLLPAAAVDWDNNSLLEHFQAQQQKLVAFANGLHMQLGAVSGVLGLNKQVLIMIANALLGRSLVESTVVGPMGEHTAEELHASTIYDMIANEGDM